MKETNALVYNLAVSNYWKSSVSHVTITIKILMVTNLEMNLLVIVLLR